MKIIKKTQIAKTDLIIVPLLKNKISKDLAENIDKSLLSEIQNLSKKLKKDKAITQHLTYKKQATDIIVIHLSDEKKLADHLSLIANNITKDKKEQITILISDLSSKSLSTCIEGLHEQLYVFDKYLSDPEKKAFYPESITFISNMNKAEFEQLSQESLDLSLAIDYIKNLVNTPPVDCTPSTLAQEAKQIAKASRLIKTKILEEKDILKEKMNLLYSVGAGSNENSKLIQLEYKSKKAKNKKTILIVGKGVTFDAGGLNIKPTGYIETMKCDMAGAGAVLGLFYLLSHIDLPIHIIGLIPSVENLVGNKAYKPGDILRAHNGKTVEIINTDAEGRLILADALSYGVDTHNPESVIDLATLTGACIAALGYTHTAIVSNNDKLSSKIESAAKHSDSLVHRLPLTEFYQDKVKGEISDYKNYTAKIGAGTVMAGAFLEKFINETPWVHLDIAGTAFLEAPLLNQKTGATGAPLKLLYTLLKEY